MKILLDECVTKKLKAYLSDYDVFTVSEMKWNGLKNGRLLDMASMNGFDMLLTIDQNLSYQKDISKYNIIVCIIKSRSSKMEVLVKYIPSLLEKITSFKKSNFYLITE